MRLSSSIAVVFASVLVALSAARSALAQSKYRPRVEPDGFGERVACLGDVDEDGAADFAIAAPTDGGRRGAIYVVSGTTCKAIYVVRGLDGIQHLGVNMQSGGDVDGDGVLDMLVSNAFPTWGDRPAANVVKILSGRDGQCVRSNVATNGERWIGGSARIIDDVQGDCHAEYAIGTITSGPLERSLVVVFDGKTGSELARVAIDAPDDFQITSIASFRDPHWRDGVQIAVGCRERRFFVPDLPIEVRFVANGALRSVLLPLAPHGTRFSGQVHAIGDVDADGVRDLALSSMRFSSHPVADLEVVSARTSARLWSRQLAEFPPTPDDSIALGAECVVPCADIDGDRVPDLFVSNDDAGVGGMVWALSGKTGELLYSICGELHEWLGSSICVSDSLEDSRRSMRAPRVLVVGCRMPSITEAVERRSHVHFYSLVDGKPIARLFSDDLRRPR